MKKELLLLLAILLLYKQADCQAADSVVLPNAVLYYYTYGSGEPLIMLSGGPGGRGHSMEHLVANLNKNYRVILFDQRGTGRSWTKPFDSTTINLEQAIEDIDALRKKLRLSQINLVGRSWGSMLAAGYINHYPERVGLFISICGGELDTTLQSTIKGNIKAVSHDRDSARYRYWSHPDIVRLDSAKAAYERTKIHMLTRVYDSTKIDAMINRQTRPGTRSTEMGRLMWKSIPQQLRFAKAGHAFKGKALIVFGWHDPISLTTVSQYMQAFPGAEVQGIFKSGHFVELEQPDLFYPVVNAFLQRNLPVN